MNGFSRRLLEELREPEFRHAYVAEHIRVGIAYQIRALRRQRGWSQAELGRRAGMTQSAISRLENPDYGRLSLLTLRQLAQAFDIALRVRFLSFSDLLHQVSDLRPQALEAVSFAEDQALVTKQPIQATLEKKFKNTIQKDSAKWYKSIDQRSVGALPSFRSAPTSKVSQSASNLLFERYGGYAHVHGAGAHIAEPQRLGRKAAAE